MLYSDEIHVPDQKHVLTHYLTPHQKSDEHKCLRSFIKAKTRSKHFYLRIVDLCQQNLFLMIMDFLARLFLLE